jgi:hypothetical protein
MEICRGCQMAVMISVNVQNEKMICFGGKLQFWFS